MKPKIKKVMFDVARHALKQALRSELLNKSGTMGTTIVKGGDVVHEL